MFLTIKPTQVLSTQTILINKLIPTILMVPFYCKMLQEAAFYAPLSVGHHFWAAGCLNASKEVRLTRLWMFVCFSFQVLWQLLFYSAPRAINFVLCSLSIGLFMPLWICVRMLIMKFNFNNSCE